MNSQLKKRIGSATVLIPCVLFILWLGGPVLAGVLVLLYGVALRELQRISVWNNKTHWTIVLFGAVYIAFSFLCMFDIAMHEPALWGPLCVFIAVWLSDTGGYLLGKTIGGPKMAPKISPNKTWSGMAGACLGPAIGLFFYQIAFDYISGYPHNYTEISFFILAIEFGVIIGFAGQCGDLLVSYFKRRAGLKDTGQLIPGHGGLLDRIDALLLVTILFWCWMMLGGYQVLFHIDGGWRPIWLAQ